MAKIKKIIITDDQRKRALELYDFSILKGSVTNGKGNTVGSLGEIIVLDYYGAEYVGSVDYDMLIKGKKVDVKTKKQKVEPNGHHTHNIFAYNTTQKCDYYCFVVISDDLSTGWIVGWKEKNSFLIESTFRRKGEVDGNSSFQFRDDCYCLNIKDLD